MSVSVRGVVFSATQPRRPLCRHVQGRVPVLDEGVHIRARLDQSGHVGGLLHLDRLVERRLAAVVVGVHLGPTRHQSGDHAGPASVSRPVKR